MQREATPGRGATLRALALALVFTAVTGTLVAASLSWLKDARLGRPTLELTYARMLGKRLPALAEAGSRKLQTVAVLGDSSIVSYPDGQTVPERLQQAVDGLGPDPGRIHIASLAMPGAGPFDYYFTADRVADAGPDLVVIALNLDHFSKAWQGAYSRPHLAALIEPPRLVEALTLPLHWTGLTGDRLLFYIGIVQAGGYQPFYWLSLRQAQMARARDRFERWLQGGGEDTPEQRFKNRADEHTIARLFTAADIRHYRRAGLLEHYQETLAGLEPDHPVVAVLAATVERFRNDGVAVLVYLTPVEVSWLEAQGILNPSGLERSIDVMRQAVESSGGSFVDLHARLPADAFRDAPGHLAFPKPGQDGIDGPRLLADVLAPLVIENLD